VPQIAARAARQLSIVVYDLPSAATADKPPGAVQFLSGVFMPGQIDDHDLPLSAQALDLCTQSGIIRAIWRKNRGDRLRRSNQRVTRASR
jgi:hypothetical protein